MCIIRLITNLMEMQKQDKVTKSSIKVEYQSMSLISFKIVRLKLLLLNFGISYSKPTLLYANNTSAIRITTNPVHHE